MENFTAIEELFYWDLTFHLLGVASPKYYHFHDDGYGNQELCTDQNCMGHNKENMSLTCPG